MPCSWRTSRLLPLVAGLTPFVSFPAPAQVLTQDDLLRIQTGEKTQEEIVLKRLNTLLDSESKLKQFPRTSGDLTNRKLNIDLEGQKTLIQEMELKGIKVQSDDKGITNNIFLDLDDFPIEPKAVGGQKTDAFPETVKITYDTNAGARFCSGVKIAKDHILTAGHCLCGSNFRVQFRRKETSSSPYSLSALFGDLTEPIKAQAIKNQAFICGEDIDKLAGEDYGLLRFSPSDKPSDDGSKIARLGSVAAPYILEDKKLWAAGYGATETSNAPKSLVTVSIDLFKPFCSTGSFGKAKCSPYREFILANSSATPLEKPTDTCKGDSGGPVHWLRTNKYTDTLVVGLTSRAIKGTQQLKKPYCGGGGIYTNTFSTATRAWIESRVPDVRYVSLEDAINIPGVRHDPSNITQ